MQTPSYLAKQTLFVHYNGYGGDTYYANSSALTSQFPEAKITREAHIGYLTQKGHGPGYFNNSYVYHRFFKVTFKKKLTEEQNALVNKTLQIMGVKIIATKEEYNAQLKEMWGYAKRMKKQNPY